MVGEEIAFFRFKNKWIENTQALAYRVGVSRWEKTLEKILSAQSDANIRFDDVVSLLVRLGFSLRVKGSHHVFRKGDKEINIQPAGSHCKPYQVRQIREALK